MTTKGKYGEPLRVNDVGTLMTYGVDCVSAIAPDTPLGLERAKEIIERCQQCTNAMDGLDPAALPELVTAINKFFAEWDDEESLNGVHQSLEALRQAACKLGVMEEKP